MYFSDINVNQVQLHLKNPRHASCNTQDAVINFLCENENIYELAKDIAEHGLNPIDLFGVVPFNTNKDTYFVAEGNRRFCAILLLNSYNLAPTKYKHKFEKLSQHWRIIDSISAFVFKNQDDANLWIKKLHAGQQGGAGRKSWNAEQKTRFDRGSNHNKPAQQILDYAMSKKILSNKEREKKITTVQRFIQNPTFRALFGIELSSDKQVSRTRSKSEFDKILKIFIKDLVTGKDVNSRKNKVDIITYAQKLLQEAKLENNFINPPIPIIANDTSETDRPSKPQRPLTPININFNAEIDELLKKVNNYKLQKLYFSICNLKLKDHTPLISVGIWSFIETLTALDGKNEQTSFKDYLNKQKIQILISRDIGRSKAELDAISNIAKFGNTTKHHPTAAFFNSEQLTNDFQLIEPIILKLVENNI